VIFSRRSIQDRLDAIRDTVPSGWFSELVERLNKPSRDRLAALYELVVIHGLLSVGEVRIEVEQPSGKRPDVTFVSPQVNFVADVTSVSDAGLDEANPYEGLSELVETLKNKIHMPIGGVDIQIGARTERKGRGQQTRLQMPDRSDLGEFFKAHVEPEIRRQHELGRYPIKFQITDNATEIAVTIDPSKGPYSFGGYASFDRPTIVDRNPLYRALKAKAKQLKGVDGVKGIIVGDADCASMAEHGLGGSEDTWESMTREFLRQNSSVDFVLLLSVRQKQRSWHPAMGYDRQMFAALRTQPDFQLSAELSYVFEQMGKSFPTPKRMPINAARRAMEDGYGLGLHGAFKRSGKVMRVSSRMIMEVLAGKTPVEKLSQFHDQNPFSLPFTEGKLPTKIEVIPGEEDEDDDWIEFTFDEQDPAISPFK
jgi:hypothetical protein|tara:strand:+ start:3025 stop:4296 length:1272 start_codon:yes stop_codon:yes gene_type:complete